MWTMSLPVYNNAMQEFNHLSFMTSEQHKECTEARIERDSSDLSKVSSKLIACIPFSEELEKYC